MREKKLPNNKTGMTDFSRCTAAYNNPGFLSSFNPFNFFKGDLPYYKHESTQRPVLMAAAVSCVVFISR